MSFDLDIVTSQMLEPRHLNDFFSGRQTCHFEGGLYDQGTNVLVWRQTRSGDKIPAFTADSLIQATLHYFPI